MLLLRVIDSRGEVTQHFAEKFPCSIGRAGGSDLQVAAPGVWDRHATIDLTGDGHFMIRPEGGGLVLVNGTPIPEGGETPLALGQELTFGSARLVASLAPARQKGLALGELAVWGLLLLVVLAESALIILVA